jgi:hypothetical protein
MLTTPPGTGAKVAWDPPAIGAIATSALGAFVVTQKTWVELTASAFWVPASTASTVAAPPAIGCSRMVPPMSALLM